MNVKQYLPESAQENINKAVSESEKKINAEIVPVFMVNSNNYEEAPLKGAVISMVVTGLAILTYDHIRDWYESIFLQHDWLFLLAIMIGGIIGYVVVSLVPIFKFIFSSEAKRTKSSKVMAESVFAEFKLYETTQRNGILVFVSLFERRIHIIPDRLLDEAIPKDEWTKIINNMKPNLKSKQYEKAFLESIREIENLLLKYNFSGSSNRKNELPDHVRKNLE